MNIIYVLGFRFMSLDSFIGSYTDRPAHRMLDIRLVGPVSGKYMLTEAANDGRRRAFSCHTQSISTQSVVLNAPVSGDVTENVVLRLNDFGPMQGRINRIFPGGFAMDIDADGKGRAEIAAKIDWIKKRRFRAFKERRVTKRFVPANPRAALTLPDGSVHESLIIDASRTGVAVSLAVQPAVGSRAAVGRVSGTIVRHLETGFALKFDTELADDEIEDALSWPTSFRARKAKRNVA